MMIYLDNAATTFPKPESVYCAMDKANREYAINAGRGSYRLAQAASNVIFETKNMLRRLVKAEANVGVVFTPSITIALNQIIGGMHFGTNDVIYVSPFEHNAVARTLHHISKKTGIRIKILPLDEQTLEIDLERTKYEFSKDKPKAVFCTHVSNVTGYVLPVEQIFAEAKEYNAWTILDVAQSLGLIEVDVRKFDVDIIAFAGHKTLYGPLGIGGFINIGSVDMEEVIVGGTGSDSLNLEMPSGVETKYESASTNIVAVYGLNAALKVLKQNEHLEHEIELTQYLVDQLKKLTGIKMFLPESKERHVGIVSFIVEGFSSEDIGDILDADFDIAVRTGYHCAPWIHRHLKDESSQGTIRVGVGQFNKKADIDKLVDALREIQM